MLRIQIPAILSLEVRHAQRSSPERRLQIHDGEPIVASSRRGSIAVKARVSEDVPSGITFIPFHFAGSPANVLTNPAVDPACKMPEFKVCAIKIEKGEVHR